MNKPSIYSVVLMSIYNIPCIVLDILELKSEKRRMPSFPAISRLERNKTIDFSQTTTTNNNSVSVTVSVPLPWPLESTSITAFYFHLVFHIIQSSILHSFLLLFFCNGPFCLSHFRVWRSYHCHLNYAFH